MPDNKELIGILKDLRDYISNEYNLNVDARSYKGENAVDESLPADWQKKLEPISGGSEGGHEGDKGAEKKATKAGSQSSDAYLHKQDDVPQKGASNGFKAEGLDVQTKAVDEVAVDEDEEVVDEESNDMEEYEEKMGMYKDGVESDVKEDDSMEYEDNMGEMEDMGDNGSEVVSLLRDIKNFLSNAHMEKQSVGELQAVRREVSDLAKALPEIIDRQVNDGIKAGLKQFGYSPAGGDTPRRVTTRSQVQKSKPTQIKTAVTPAPAQKMVSTPEAIGVEGDSLMKAADRISDHDTFVDGVEQLAGMTDIDDLRGTFKRINAMREQSGESLTQNLYYYRK